jgi:hypothetical protein
MPIPKNTHGRASWLALPKLSMWTDEIKGRSGDCMLYEQIVILFSSCKVLSKEQRSRLKE